MREGYALVNGGGVAPLGTGSVQVTCVDEAILQRLTDVELGLAALRVDHRARKLAHLSSSRINIQPLSTGAIKPCSVAYSGVP